MKHTIHLLLVFVGWGSSLAAQTLTNAGQLIHLTPNATVTVRGGAVNNGLLTNNGTWSVSGDWENRLTYHGTGTFVLDGDRTQRVNHSLPSGSRQLFHALHLAGAGEKILDSDAEVTSAFVLQEGILTPAPGSRLWMGARVKITGGSAASHVNGMLIHQGTGNRFYPIGKRGRYQPVVLELINGSDPVLGFEVFSLDGFPAPTLGEGVTWVSRARFWRKTAISGTFDQALITLDLDADDEVDDLERAVIVAVTDLTRPYQSLGREAATGSPTDGTVTSRLRTAAGDWISIGTVDNRAPVSPMALLYVPNVFSPSAVHAEERVFKVYSTHLAPEGVLLRIYDRWGNLVHETRSLEHLTQTGWDGRHYQTGRPLNPGVYAYTLKSQLLGGEAFERVGTVTLVE